ncbi:hypothetical protein KEJ14_02520 [Candidatus Bathyarchaeota archaeon]|nr:hypothetical protein [Candidatus Bathyarchaeota archaeon]
MWGHYDEGILANSDSHIYCSGLSTFIPTPASKPCLLGYYAHCSFTPLSTIICWAIAGVFYWLGRRKSSEK